MLSTFIQIFWISYEHAGFHCDSPAYLEFATTFWGSLPQQLTVWVRTAGYPILLAITANNKRATIFVIFIIGLTAGPAVSL